MTNPSGAEPPKVDLFKPYHEQQAQQSEPAGRAEPPTAAARPDRPRRKRNPLPWLLVVAAGAVIAIVVVVMTTMTGDEDPAKSAKGTAQQFVDAINARDVEGVNRLACTEKDKVDRAQLAATAAGTTQIQVKNVSEPNNGQAILTVTAVVNNQQTQDRFPMSQRPDGTWCVGEQGGTTG